MRPYLENLPWTEDSSLALLNRRLEGEIPFQWHHHPEWELTLTLNSTGQRFVGDHIGDYTDGDLVLVGPNLPHTWMSRARIASGPHRALVIWFGQDWLDRFHGLPEWEPLKRLSQRGGRGLAFSPRVSQEVRPLIEAFFDSDPQDRFLVLLKILVRLADGDSTALASTAVERTAHGVNRDRIERVLTYLHSHFEQRIELEELAAIAALSVSGLHRLFVKQTGQTVTEYLMALRIGAAAAQLVATELPIAHIAADVGYGALANFNRQFRALKGITPSAYRKAFRV
ncbi:AraC family transcriptional regulator [Marivivens sp. LCG002]|uniref:AraC family transcriptional regulator n=1 Tax=Marivivens sp. LCG002 TaxID=3051171 RepID=UPI002555E84F|nr:AraC family transcriptional regulator [Marivivens sp. LCG002]WIV50262.1 AraC family transcriptional regulator [Marivivens sp. LCG002]